MVKMKGAPLLVLILFSGLIHGQIKGRVMDSITQQPIPYVNIWIENENIGTTSNEMGQYEFHESLVNKVFIFSAIGFKTKKVHFNNLSNTILLPPKITALEEVVVSYKSEEKELKIGKFKKSKIGLSAACGKKPWIIARFFPFKDEYNETRFVKSIKVRTDSDIKNAKFNIRLYAKKENGEPGRTLYNQNIIGMAKRGKRYTEIDLSTYDVYFPSTGLFIAIEWLIIEENRIEFETNGKEKHISYEPAFGLLPSETGENSMIYLSGKWQGYWKCRVPENYKDKYGLLAMELTLSN